MLRFRRSCLSALVPIVALTGAACYDGGAGGGGMNPMTPTPPDPVRFVINIQKINGPFSFSPQPANAPDGQPIVWRNHDGVTHRIVLDAAPIDTGNIAPNTDSAPAEVPLGTWTYHCTIHPEMIGTINVTREE